VCVYIHIFLFLADCKVGGCNKLDSLENKQVFRPEGGEKKKIHETANCTFLLLLVMLLGLEKSGASALGTEGCSCQNLSWKGGRCSVFLPTPAEELK
jgi:hypothetical protein